MQDNQEKNNQIIIYNTEDGETKIEAQIKDETVWLSQKQMAELFQTTVAKYQSTRKKCAKRKTLAIFAEYFFDNNSKFRSETETDCKNEIRNMNEFLKIN